MPSTNPLIDTLEQAGYTPVHEVPLPGIDACHVELSEHFSALTLLRDAYHHLQPLRRAPVLIGAPLDLPDWLDNLHGPRSANMASAHQIEAVADALYARQSDVSEVLAWDDMSSHASTSDTSLSSTPPRFPEHALESPAHPLSSSSNCVIALSPTSQPEDLLLALRFGDFHEAPPADRHVAILRYWKRLWGARLIACTPTSLTLATHYLAPSWSDAFALAAEHIAYCPQLTLEEPAAIKSRANLLKTQRIWHFDWATEPPVSPYLF